MNYNQRISLSVIVFLLIIYLSNANAQVTIGSHYTPKSGALLDLKESTAVGENSKKGLLLPRVLLEGKLKLEPTVQTSDANKESHIGLTVYHTGSEELCEGVYTWNGTQWNKLGSPCGLTVDPALLYGPNCYIVNPGESQIIPAAKAYLAWDTRPDLTSLSLSDKVSADLLWQDTQGLITSVGLENGSDKNQYSNLKVVTTSGKTGNAVVAVRIGPNGNTSDPICWSWHIWVTTYNPDAPTGSDKVYMHNNGEADYTFMDRNLGALTTSDSDINSMGLLYEWGRKDPFTSGTQFGYSTPPRTLYDINNNTLIEMDELQSGYNPANHNGFKHQQVPDGIASMLDKSIQNPMIYYYGTKSLTDWYTSLNNTGDPNLWGATDGKSIFDPCPAGWRVPTLSSPSSLSPWAKFDSSSSGGWDDGSPADFDTTSNGIYMKTSSYDLGFYPYMANRIPYTIYSGNVGSSTPFIGGLFPSLTLNNGNGVYWIANSSATAGKAKLLVFYHPGMMPMLETEDAERAVGAAVRCVKE